ncbi:MAG: hypothetical protein HQL03_15250 [Nitrospirae bacterium]|nr:hypothetical protein [Nitrospirota bacterium]
MVPKAHSKIYFISEGYYEPGIMAPSHTASDSKTYYKMAYRVSAGALAKIELASGKTSINAVSCQINKNLITYTYRLYTNGDFQYRVLGIINMANGQRDEFISQDDEPSLADFPLSGLAAIGIA